MPPKFRLFGGPNGSGKTFLFDQLRENGTIHTELYINADKILRDIRERGNFNFNAYRVKTNEDEFRKSVASSGLLQRMNDPELLKKISLKSGVLKFAIDNSRINAYHASFIATYLATKLFETGQSFCFETVMSHKDKLSFFALAANFKYKSYLYFVFTDNPELNIARVKLRAAEGLHDVDSSIIESRYLRTFALLPKAFGLADEAYIIDNSHNPRSLIVKRQQKISLTPNTVLTHIQSKLLAEVIRTIGDGIK